MGDDKIKIIIVIFAILISISFLAWSNVKTFADMDQDGVMDAFDNCANYPNKDQWDFDSDSLGDECDPDDDNDGVLDVDDVFDENPSEWKDFDLDNIGDNSDIDDDNDNIIDALDAFDTNYAEWSDFDFDGIGAVEDSDDDNDGIIDNEDDDPTLPSEDLTVKYLKEIQDCANLGEGTTRLLCYSEFFGTVAENEENNTNALELSIALAKLGTIDDCHFVAHEIGHVSYLEKPDVIENLMGVDGSLCRGGYFHGVLASYFHDVKEAKQPFPTTFNTICDALIGSSNYQDCVHGLGHGLVHYFEDDLSASVNSCHGMSFYQNRLCIKGVMMQYTDNALSRNGISSEVIGNLCTNPDFDQLDIQECSMSIGTTLAFHTNHNFKEGEPFCKLIDDQDTKNWCMEGLRLEIEDSEGYNVAPLNQEVREKYQPQFIDENSTIDIRSPAIISDFNYLSEIEMIQFKIDRPSYVIMYIPIDLIPDNGFVTVNGKLIKDAFLNSVSLEKYVVFQFFANESGIVLISPLA